MTCRCSSKEEHASHAVANARASHEAETKQLKKRLQEAEESLVDSNRFTIMDAQQVGKNLVLMVQYPSCPKCTYEGKKVMVFLDTSAIDALKWKKVDPHFRDDTQQDPHESPSPAARFPATGIGWKDAIDYAQRKM
jgi:ribosomal protein L44E